MKFARYIHHFIIGISILVLLGSLLALVTYLAYYGYIWDSWQRYAVEAVAKTKQSLPSLEFMRTFGAVIGGLATVASAVWGIVRGLRYAETSLPTRLMETLAGFQHSLMESREPLMASIGNRRLPEIDQAQYFVQPLRDGLDHYAGSKVAASANSLATAAEVLSEKIDIANKQLEGLKQQKALAHLMKGLSLMRLADQSSNASEAHDLRDQAEQEFSIILNDIDPNDLDALEQRGRVRQMVQSIDLAQEDFEKLEQAAKNSRRALYVGRALRLQGELILQRDTQLARKEAQRKFDSGVAAIQGLGALNAEQIFEAGLLHKLLGQVRIRQNVTGKAEHHLDQAITWLKDSRHPNAPTHRQEAEAALTALKSDGSEEAPQAQTRRFWFAFRSPKAKH